MKARRLYAPVVLGTLTAGGLALIAVGRVWASSKVVADGLSTDTVTVSGSDAHPLASAMALVIIAAALAILASANRIRRAVGMLTVLGALIGIWVVTRGSAALDRALAAAVEQSPAFTGTNMPDDIDRTGWHLVAVAAFAVAAALGVVTVRLAPRWPTMGSRYDAPPVRPAPQPAPADHDMWKALDEGRDPTQ